MIAADYALSAFAWHNNTFGVYIKLKHVIDLLCAFDDDFPFEDPTSDLNMGGKVIIDGTNYAALNTPLGVLYALKRKLATRVRFPCISLPLNADKPDKP